MALKLESLYYFSVLADSGSFTAAAEKLFMTQQALSRQIAALEQALGKTLIERNQGQGQRLTPAGEILRAEAQPLLARLSGIETRLGTEAASEIELPLRIGAILVLDAGIAGILQQWCAREPSFRPVLTLPIGGPAAIESQLLAGQLDLGLLLAPPVSQGLAWMPLTPEPYVIVGKPGTCGEWNDLSYLSYLGNLQSQDAVLNVWPESDYPRQIVSSADVAMALELAVCGAACLHIPRHFVDFSQLAEICPPPFEASFTPCLVWQEQSTLPPLLDKIRAEILASVRRAV